MEELPTVRQCSYPWTWFLVGIEGYARPCCFSSCPVGDVTLHTPEQVWNNATMQSLRASARAGVVHTVCRGAACKFVAGSLARDEAKDAQASDDPVAELDEGWYVANHFDVQIGIRKGSWASGREHYRRFGHREFRARNRAEFERLLEKRKKAATRCYSEYWASLKWAGTTGVEGQKLCVRFDAENAGSASWPVAAPDGVDGSIRAGARLVRDLSGSLFPALREFRSDLRWTLEPGETTGFSIEIDLSEIPPDQSFLVIDMVRENRFWFSDLGTEPLVLGLSFPKDTTKPELEASISIGASI